ncbi:MULTISPECIES: DUF2264 domain-containing protein [Agrobacterium tumefaciens complex]|uniref:DUF2264 domain-containing protein n=1 Tax=Agrobacterium radiobacter TaxID=362 RepID=A0ABR6J7X0_AGRRD|nr:MULTISPECIES: DUF2264 domain-containing protein [Agrobacterium tumefaciens complex]TGE76741.1 DUF2264 domain-containing protein [Rhizobium sp. SEMIA 439]EPR20940.1 hypothetical protein L902_28010 [Agrobacterium radiobacter DSM 30147]KAB0456300.1 DUF2264 domain-containing protein [Agrobacterium tumefaciens]MBB4319472.1 hypothetical protein [Agrobacterium radiobacter]MBB4337996.1 hypothetical protein [Agrobacterium radiobacter]
MHDTMTRLNMARFNPLHGNPLKTRADVRRALDDSFAPLLPYFSQGSARVTLSGAAAHFDRAAADLEGFARPLWGIAPLALSGDHFDHWPLLAQGIANGTDPSHPEYWGDVRQKDQRLVELAAIGFALRLAPQHLWEPLSDVQKDNVRRYLLTARERNYADNNWKFFRVMVDMALDHLGIEFDRSLTEAFQKELDEFYIADGWYRDGNYRRIDHYIAFAMHFYSLIYAKLSKPDDAYAERYRERARLFAGDFASWFDEDGGTLAFGRSMTYRFACGGFWAGLAFADEEALPWGEIKGLYLQHLRWWAKKPIADRDGVLSIGYAYPQLTMSESYNSAGSPYWAFKAFLPLALPENHPFWLAEEKQPETSANPKPLAHPGMVMMRATGNVTALSSGQENLSMRGGPEKYAKFAYSSRYGFGVEVDERGFRTNGFDNMLAFSEDGLHYRVRETNEKVLLAGESLRATWKPFPDVDVETTLVAAGDWHVRLHRIRSTGLLSVTEGGFAISRNDGDRDAVSEEAGRATADCGADISAIIDLGSSIIRHGVALKTLPNTNLINAKTTVPQLRGEIPAGETLLACAVFAGVAGPESEKALATVPALPDMEALDRLFAEQGVPVSSMAATGEPQ